MKALITAALMLATVAPAQVRPPVATDQAASLAAIGAMGRLLYRYDQAAWHTTDAMLAAVPRERLVDIRGWVVQARKPDVLTVTYFRLADGKPSALFVADYDGKSVSNARFTDALQAQPLDAEGARMAQAIGVVRQQRLGLCTNGNPNTVVFPPDAQGNVAVYMMSAQVDTSEVPMGGHYRFDIDATGKIAHQRTFTKSCLNMPWPPKNLPKGATGVTMGIGHLLDPLPTEIHVFQSLTHRIPMAVQTSTGTWLVAGDRIRNVAAAR